MASSPLPLLLPVVAALSAFGSVARAQDEMPDAIEERREPGMSAESDQRARSLYARGQAQFERGEHQRAIVSFEAAYELSNRPLLLYNISLAYEELDDDEQAAEYLERYLRDDREITASERRRLQAHLRRLRAPSESPAFWIGGHAFPQLWLSVLDDVMLHLSVEARYRLAGELALAAQAGYATVGKSGMSGGSEGFTLGLGVAYGHPLAESWRLLFRGLFVFEDYFSDQGGGNRTYFALRPGVGVSYRLHARVTLELTAEAAGGLSQFSGGGVGDEVQSDFAIIAGARFAVLFGLF
ncbi:MAG: hypothetical protein IT379_01330 [Deltaproteobacteria bacterium]|nr:hypothetical protein [Deltaproteobacteria bacterium]